MSNIIIFIILGTALILILPLHKRFIWIKNIVVALTVSFLIATPLSRIFISDPQSLKEEIPIKITALNTQNEKAEGNEIWLMGFIVDGIAIPADSMRGGGGDWIKKDGCLLWRSYDRPEGMIETLTGGIPAGKELQIDFEKNKWRGQVEIEIEGQKKVIDCYDSNKSGGVRLPVTFTLNYNKYTGEDVLPINKRMFLIIFFVVFVIILFIFIISSKLEKPSLIVQRKTNERKVWPDLLRIVSIFMIVWLHYTCNIYNSFSTNHTWRYHLLVNCLTTFAVPCFFMLSGYFVLKKNTDVKFIYLHRLPRLVIPLIVWSIVYILVKKYIQHIDLPVFNTILHIPFSAQYGHVWFLYSLISCYLLVPLLGAAYKNLSMKEKVYGIIIFSIIPAIFETIIPLLGGTLPNFWTLALPRELGVFWTGAVLSELKHKFKSYNILCGLLLSYTIVVLFSYIKSISQGSPSKEYFDMGRIPVYSFSIYIFVFFSLMENFFRRTPDKIKEIISNISKLTFGIYLSHMLFMTVFDTHPLLKNNQGTHFDMFFGAVLCFIVSLSFTLIVSRIPYVRKFVL
jgi:surface polysaccharide O-acyltransferase-like enzyme